MNIRENRYSKGGLWALRKAAAGSKERKQPFSIRGLEEKKKKRPRARRWRLHGTRADDERARQTEFRASWLSIRAKRRTVPNQGRISQPSTCCRSTDASLKQHTRHLSSLFDLSLSTTDDFTCFHPPPPLAELSCAPRPWDAFSIGIVLVDGLVLLLPAPHDGGQPVHHEHVHVDMIRRICIARVPRNDGDIRAHQSSPAVLARRRDEGGVGARRGRRSGGRGGGIRRQGKRAAVRRRGREENGVRPGTEPGRSTRKASRRVHGRGCTCSGSALAVGNEGLPVAAAVALR